MQVLPTPDPTYFILVLIVPVLVTACSDVMCEFAHGIRLELSNRTSSAGTRGRAARDSFSTRVSLISGAIPGLWLSPAMQEDKALFLPVPLLGTHLPLTPGVFTVTASISTAAAIAIAFVAVRAVPAWPHYKLYRRLSLGAALLTMWWCTWVVSFATAGGR